MERFFYGKLKMERVWQRQYVSHDEEARRDINQYIINFLQSRGALALDC